MSGLPASIDTPDGVRLRLHGWPAAGQPRLTVLLVHGLGEHVGRLAPVVRRLNAFGCTVAGYDQRGHGESGGARGSIAHADDLLCDLALVIDTLRAAWPRTRDPLLLLGDSLGGLVAARFVAELTLAPEHAAPWRREVDGLVLASPALDPGMNAAQKLLLALLGPLAPWLAVSSGLAPQWLSHDPAVGAAYMADPLVHDRITARLARFIVDAGVVVRERARAWRTPTLLMWAGADALVAPAGSAAFAAAAPAALVQSHCFEGLYHEIFNELPPDREQVFARLLHWLAAYTEATTSRSGSTQR